MLYVYLAYIITLGSSITWQGSAVVFAYLCVGQQHNLKSKLWNDFYETWYCLL